VISERLAYDPWGRRRFASGLPDTLDSISGLATDRGYTMHEHLDEMGIIHMNGRVFDPLIGRFMSADPFIPDASNLQAHNRYAYVYNNPLKYTDPDGYKPKWLKKLGKIFVRAVAAIADFYGCGGYCSAAVGAYAQRAWISD
jgi:RHS repeat-associated protein